MRAWGDKQGGKQGDKHAGGAPCEISSFLRLYSASRQGRCLSPSVAAGTVQVHENRLIAKIFTFYFIDCFLWFFLLAFFHIPFGRQIDYVPSRPPALAPPPLPPARCALCAYLPCAPLPLCAGDE